MKLNDISASKSPRTTPIKIMGIEPKIINGCLNPLNRNTMIVNIKIKHGANILDIPPIASS